MTKLASLAMTILVLITVCSLSACGDKGKLKSPSQIAAAEAKKTRKKEEQEKATLPVPPAAHNPTTSSPPMGQGMEGGALPSPDNNTDSGAVVSPGKGSQGQGQ